MSESSDILVPLKELSNILLELRSKLSDTLDLIILSLILFVFLNLLIYYLMHKVTDDNGHDHKFRFFRRKKLPENTSRALIVTAHPGKLITLIYTTDELKFNVFIILLYLFLNWFLHRRRVHVFWSNIDNIGKTKKLQNFSLMFVKRWAVDLYLIIYLIYWQQIISIGIVPTGNFDNQGKVRKQELWDSCEVLGIESKNITLCNCTLLPDNPKAEWKAELLSDIIKGYVESLDIDLLITFDRDGISHHKNHQAIYFATASLYLSGAIPVKCRVLVLSTVNIVRKYLSIFDVLLSLLISSNWWACLNLNRPTWSKLIMNFIQ